LRWLAQGSTTISLEGMLARLFAVQLAICCDWYDSCSSVGTGERYRAAIARGN